MHALAPRTYSRSRRRCILVYSGIHYDAVTLSPLPASPPAFHTTVFPVYDTSLLDAAERLVSQLRAKHYYTDTANFDLRCAICRVGLKGEKGAQEHAKQTGRESRGAASDNADEYRRLL